MIYKDRKDGGRELAEKLHSYKGQGNFVILAVSGGGVPVGFEISRTLHTALDIFPVRRLAVPGQDDLSLGIIAPDGILIPNRAVMRYLNVSDLILESIAAENRAELDRVDRTFRKGLAPLYLTGKTVILVDDGFTAPSAMQAAVQAARHYKPYKTLVALPIATAGTCEILSRDADEVVCAITSTSSRLACPWYEKQEIVLEKEICRLLKRSRSNDRRSELRQWQPDRQLIGPTARSYV